MININISPILSAPILNRAFFLGFSTNTLIII